LSSRLLGRSDVSNLSGFAPRCPIGSCDSTGQHRDPKSN
jgi:hypothetical protein